MIDQGTYPQLRPGRIGGGSAPGLQLAPLPRSRVFSWGANITATSRRSLSTPRMQGPVIIKGVSWYLSTKNAGAVVSVELGYASTSVTENGVNLGNVRPYTVLTELIDPFAVVASNSGRGLIDSTQPATVTRWQEPLDLIVDQNDVFVVLAIWNNSASAQFWNGELRCVENVLRSALEQYF